MTAHSSILVWKIPWMEELQSGLAGYSLWGSQSRTRLSDFTFHGSRGMVKNVPAMQETQILSRIVPELGRFLGEGNGNPL